MFNWTPFVLVCVFDLPVDSVLDDVDMDEHADKRELVNAATSPPSCPFVCCVCVNDLGECVLMTC